MRVAYAVAASLDHQLIFPAKAGTRSRGYGPNLFDKFSGADSIGHGGTCPPLLQMAGHGCTVSRRTAVKQETDQTVVTTTKALTKTTNCAFRAKKVEGHDPKKFPALHAGSAPLHFQIRSGATGQVAP